MKLIACLRIRNESWIINYTLSALSEFVDEILIIDDGSEDETVEICRSCPKVTEIVEKGIQYDRKRNETADWNSLAKMAVKRGADWIWGTDADEMVEPKIKSEIQAMMSDPRAGLYRFRKVSPWKGLEYFRTDRSRFDHKASDALNPVLVRAADCFYWPNPKGSFIESLAKRILRGDQLHQIVGRIMPKGIAGEVINRDDLVCIHFNHVDFNKLIKRQIFYAINEKTDRPFRTNRDILDWAYKGIDETGMELAPVKKEWLWQDYLKSIIIDK